MQFVKTTSSPFRVMLWLISYGGALLLIGLTFFAPFLLGFLFLIVVVGLAMLSFFNIKLQWSSDKIRNLHLYKIALKEKSLTPYEKDLLDNYFGLKIKEPIRDLKTLTKYKRMALLLDLGSLVIMFFAGATYFVFYKTPEISNDTITVETILNYFKMNLKGV